MVEGGIVDYRERVRRAEVLLESSPISETNKRAIRRFMDFKTAQRISLPRQDKYLRLLRLLAERYIDGKDFEELTRDDVISAVAQIERSDLKTWVKYDYEYFLKTLLTFLGREEAISWLKIKTPRRVPDDVLTVEEVERMIATCENARDRALIAMLFEAGTRIAEVGNLRIGDLEFDRIGAIAKVTGKTGFRPVRFIWATPYLTQWLEAHPFQDQKDAPLWVNLRGRGTQLRYDAIRMQLQKIAKRAGIEKRVNPHNFRHTRLTLFMKERRISEGLIKQYMGLTPDSRVLSVYSHLTGRDVDQGLMAMYGLAVEEEKRQAIRQCPYCRTINTPAARVCINCRKHLQVEEVLDLEARSKAFLLDMMDAVANDPEKVEQLKAFYTTK
jgi:integrase/recombinase XerD